MKPKTGLVSLHDAPDILGAGCCALVAEKPGEKFVFFPHWNFGADSKQRDYEMVLESFQTGPYQNSRLNLIYIWPPFP